MPETCTAITSPITGTTAVVVEEELNAQTVIDRYAREYNIDVAHYFARLNSIKICRCLETGYRFYYPFSLIGQSELYHQLQDYPWYYADWKWEYQIAAEVIQANQKVLEIGCGRGKFLKFLQNQGAVCVGCELNDDAVLVAKANGLEVRKQTIQDLSRTQAALYDVVCSFQVLEHVVEVQSFLQAAIAALKPGGKLIVGVPNSNPFLYEHDKYDTLNLPPHHMGLWRSEALSNLAPVFNLKVDNIYTEPLHPADYERYLRLKLAHLPSSAELLVPLLEFILLKLRPYRLRSRLQRWSIGSAPGRNLVAVYTKL
ncbi:hypothetical protein LEP3755_20500 [Leptolyngbya sp. NIES-3755]|nr:hypothetical protein LEP3755_20500 [Leptolyngbya sp. NIES-3755]